MLHTTSFLKLCSAALVVLAFVASVLVGLSFVAAHETSKTASAWKSHRELCLQIPEEVYLKDRSRALRGIVHDTAGKPISGALVQCIRAESLLQLARSVPPAPTLWSGLVETEARTNSEGRYEFPYLAEGSRTICVSAPGFAPAVQSFVVVQDGTGARIDVTLDFPKTLRLQLNDVGDRPRRIHLVPYRWWPDLVSHDVRAGEARAEIPGLGGPFRKGLVLVSDLGNSARWKVSGAFDLDRSDGLTVSCARDALELTVAIPEAACIAPWRTGVSEAERLFFSMFTPVALFWPTEVLPKPVIVWRPEGLLEQRGMHGYGPHAFVPILIESRDGGSWLEWTSGASEFELIGIPAGTYRVRALKSFDQVSFARGLIVPPTGVVDLATRLGDELDLDEPLSREFMGIVRWEDGRPAEGAEVFLQDAANFRRFLQRVVTDSNGFFRVPGVPGGAQYFAFALPAKDQRAIKQLNYPRVDLVRRETWLDMSLSPHKIVGQLAEGGSKTRLDLVCTEPNGLERVVWSVPADEDGQFEITNVPHGRYVVRATSGGNATDIASLPLTVNRDLTAVACWPEPGRPQAGQSAAASGRR
jgi:Carboxypeptidase regulatory-like domain